MRGVKDDNFFHPVGPVSENPTLSAKCCVNFLELAKQHELMHLHWMANCRLYYCNSTPKTVREWLEAEKENSNVRHTCDKVFVMLIYLITNNFYNNICNHRKCRLSDNPIPNVID